MKTLIALVLIEVMLVGTNIHIGCSGMSIELEEEGQENQSSRLTRSLHALQSQLCPEGSSLERCFYSQFSMFIRMHDSIMDPVALRNIGKRNVPTRKNNLNRRQNDKNTDFTMKMIHESDLQTHLEEIRNTAAMIKILKDLFDDKNANKASEDRDTSFIHSILFNLEKDINSQNNELRHVLLPEENFSGVDGSENVNMKDSIDNVIATFLALKGNEAENKGNKESKVKKNNSRASHVEKRQLICPPDSTERECFDNAFAYYVRLLKTLNSH